MIDLKQREDESPMEHYHRLLLIREEVEAAFRTAQLAATEVLRGAKASD